jgi:GNAT superfamily N-acetyltransferase
MSITVRPAAAADASAACVVLRRSIRELCAADHGHDEAVLASWLANKTPENVRAWLEAPGSFGVVAVEDGQVRGFALVHRHGEIALCYLVPEVQHRGAGQLMLRALEDQAARWGLSAVTLTSTATARAFYEGHGYVVNGAPVSSHGLRTAYPMSKALAAGQPAGRPDDAALTVRRLRTEDAEPLVALRRQALESDPLAFGASVEDDVGLSLPFVQRALAEAEEQAIFGAFVGGRLVGMVGLHRASKVKQRHTATVWGMFVAPASRARGGGQALIEAAIRQAREWGLDRVELSVTEAAPAAHRLYERVGFRAWGRQPRALQWQGRFVDESHLVLDLREAPGPGGSPPAVSGGSPA